MQFVESALSLEWFPTGNGARWLSVALGLAGAGLSIFLFFGIIKNSLSLDFIMRLGIESVWQGTVAALAANSCLFLAWKSLAIPLPLSLASGFSLYSKSALARYIPTGIGHLLVRQLSAERWGLEKKDLLKVSLSEILVALSVAGTLAVSYFLIGTRPISLLVLAASLLLLALGSPLMSQSARSLVLSALWFGIYFLLASSAIYFFRGEPGTFFDLVQITGAYSAAWLISTLVPFFPGGVGLREISFIAVISVESSGEGYGAAILLLRVGLWLGEILFAVVSFLFLPPLQRIPE